MVEQPQNHWCQYSEHQKTFWANFSERIRGVPAFAELILVLKNFADLEGSLLPFYGRIPQKVFDTVT